jgi:hypothetical protein
MNQSELDLLQLFLGGSSGSASHPALILLGIQSDAEAIRTWLSSYDRPTLGGLTIVLRDDELAKYLAVQNWETWLALFFSKLNADTHLPALNHSKAEMSDVAREFLSGLTNHVVPSSSFRGMVNHLFGRQMRTQMMQGLIVGVSDGMFSDVTGWRVYVELMGIPRWQALELSALPEESDIISVLG